MEPDSFCSIDNPNGICLPSSVIELLTDEIIAKPEQPKNPNDKLELVMDKYGCSDEICVLKQSNILSKSEKNNLLFNHFKPIAPIDPKKWLSNTHLDQIQEQLYKMHDNYYYSFIHMIDMKMIPHEYNHLLDHEVLELTKISFVDEIKNTDDIKIIKNDKPLRTYGVVFNTDPSNKSGQHWFAMFFDFRTKGTIEDPYTIEYFNSAGSKLNNNVYEYFIQLANDISFNTKKICNFITVTNIQHQSPETGNCGAYSLYYIHARLNNVPRSYFNDKALTIDDDIITAFRKLIFIDEKKI